MKSKSIEAIINFLSCGFWWRYGRMRTLLRWRKIQLHQMTFMRKNERKMCWTIDKKPAYRQYIKGIRATLLVTISVGVEQMDRNECRKRRQCVMKLFPWPCWCVPWRYLWIRYTILRYEAIDEISIFLHEENFNLNVSKDIIKKNIDCQVGLIDLYQFQDR